jgi:hypothetical protein
LRGASVPFEETGCKSSGEMQSVQPLKAKSVVLSRRDTVKILCGDENVKPLKAKFVVPSRRDMV